MEFRDIVMKRYATKKFDGKKIPEAKINELIELIRFAPSAINLQRLEEYEGDYRSENQGAVIPCNVQPGADHYLLAPAGLLREYGCRRTDQKGRPDIEGSQGTG